MRPHCGCVQVRCRMAKSSLSWPGGSYSFFQKWASCLYALVRDNFSQSAQIFPFGGRWAASMRESTSSAL